MSKADKIRVGSSEAVWTRIYSLIHSATENKQLPSAEMWQKICDLVQRAAEDKDSEDAEQDGEVNVPGSVQEARRDIKAAFRDKFEAEGIPREQAERMAEDAATAPFERSWP